MILYLTYDGLTDPLGQSQILPYLIGLTKKGHSIHIISFEKKDRFTTGEQTILSIINAHDNLSWQPLSYTPRPPLISTFRDLRTLKKEILQLATKNKIDIIHCRSYPTTSVAHKLAKKIGAKLIFDMRGLYIDERFDGKIWNKKNLLWKFLRPRLKKLELNMLNSADAIVSLTKNAQSEINSWDNFAKKPIYVIPCNADLQHFKDSPNTDDNSPKLVYLGSVGTWYMLEEMLSFFKSLAEKHPTFEFHFMTLDSPAIIRQHAQTLGIEQDKIKIYSKTRQELPACLTQMDIAISFIKPLYSKKASSPTKVGELLSMGIPILCNKGIGDIDNLGNQHPNYVKCFTADHKNYDNIIESIPELIRIRKEEWESVRTVAKKHFSLSDGVEKYNDIYQTLLDS